MTGDVVPGDAVVVPVVQDGQTGFVVVFLKKKKRVVHCTVK